MYIITLFTMHSNVCEFPPEDSNNICHELRLHSITVQRKNKAFQGIPWFKGDNSRHIIEWI